MKRKKWPRDLEWGFSNLVLLTFCMDPSLWGGVNGGRAVLCIRRVFTSIPGPHPLDANSNSPLYL